jgi:hypothetical protein
MELRMTWSFMSVADVEVAVTRLLNTTVFAGASLPVPLLELRAIFAFYIGFGCQQVHKREDEHRRQLIEEKSKDGKIVSQPALRKTDGSLFDAGDLDALNFQVCILHEDLLAVNARMFDRDSATQEFFFMGLSTKTGYLLIVEQAATSTTPW